MSFAEAAAAGIIGFSLVAMAACYAYGLRRAAQHDRTQRPLAILAFFCGLVVAGVALLGPIDGLADASLSWHMVQHLALAFVAVPLLLLGAPVRLALAALSPRAATRLAGALHSLPVRVASHPAFAFLQFAAVLYLAHFTPLYEAALDHPAIHALEHGLFLTSAAVFWSPILAVAPAPHAPPHIVRLLMLFLALPMSAFLGFILYAMRAPLYLHYAAFPGALADQQNAGAVMWISGGAPILAALLWCVADWGARERKLGIVADRLETT
jgi:cytochrome c oxidase assembly factor CtaG